MPAFRDLIGSLCWRGHLLALVEGHGIYEADLRRALAELRYARSAEDQDRHEDNIEKSLVPTRLILDTSVRSVAAHEKVRKAKIDSELKSLRWQFPTEKTWSTALAASDLSIGSLRRSERGSGLPGRFVRKST